MEKIPPGSKQSTDTTLSQTRGLRLEMEVARCDCLVAVVGNKMIVVGGEDSEEDTSRTDIATPTTLSK